MRFDALHLIAFGPFTDRTLDFSTAPRALHVIYGLNEAGKSTALRAVRGLLFGIPHTTRDDHTHEAKRLRIGARLVIDGGAALDLVRRKGHRQTVLDPSETTIDDAVLTRTLGGMTAEMFETMFGLDPVRLREGAEALLAGKGEIGESLFAAGIGGGRLHRLLAALREEADGLYTSRARNKPLNEAILRYEEARSRVRDLALQPEAWNGNVAAITEGRTRIATLKEEEAALSVCLHRLVRAQRVLPHLARRARLLEQRDRLGDVMELPESAERDREEAEREARESEAARQELTLEVARLDGKRRSLSIPASLIAQEAAMEELTQLVGRERQAALDRPKREGELRQVEDQVRGILRGLRLGPDLADAESLRIDPARRMRIERLGRARGQLDERQRQAAENLARSQAQLAAARSELSALPPPRDGALLAVAVDRVSRDGDLLERLDDETRAASRARQAAEARLAALGLGGGDPQEACRLPVPSTATVERFASTFSGLEERTRRIDTRLEELEQQRHRLARDLDVLRRGGDVPTEADLDDARRRRDDLWSRIVRVWRAGADETVESRDLASVPLEREFPARVKAADGIADRLRRESERVARLAALLADQEAVLGERQRLADERANFARTRDETQAEWQGGWRDASIDPRSPKEMMAWLGGYERLAEQVDAMVDAEGRRDATRRRIEQDRALLVETLTSVGEAASGDEDLPRLLDRAAAVEREISRAEKARGQLSERVRQLEEGMAGLARARQQADGEVSRWDADWAEAIGALGLPADTTPEEASATLAAVDQFSREMDKKTQLDRRIEGIDRNARAFIARAQQLIDAHAPDLRPAAPSIDTWIASVELLGRRYDQGRRDQSTAEQLDDELATKRAALQREEARAARAAERLAALQAAAGAPDLVSLRELERRSCQAREIARDLRAVEDALLAAGDGASIEVLIEETRGFDADRAEAEASGLRERLEEIRVEQQDTATLIGSAEEGLRRLESQQSAAVDAAADAQEHLARIRGLAERFVRVHLAAVLLEREIERYRERNQGPLLVRASELFRRLTGGAYESLRTDFDDDELAVLRCVGKDGREVDVEGLSDGTRDQLYLALRIASLERYCQSNEPLPLILDDVLIHFDDPRAREALLVLAELAEHMQVLYFTHHHRDLALAREAVPAPLLQEHSL